LDKYFSKYGGLKKEKPAELREIGDLLPQQQVKKLFISWISRS
jgi:hypothetical protein